MFCWKCGTNNPNENSFCGKCGSALHQPGSVEKADSGALSVTPEEVGLPHRDQPLTGDVEERQPNPLVAETRVVREAPLVSSSVVASSPPPPSHSTRVYGPSFLGLNDGPSDESSDYLFEDEPQRSASPAAWLLLLVLVGLGAYVFLHWSTVRATAATYAEKYGLIQKSQPTTEVADNSPSSISTTNAAGEEQSPDQQSGAATNDPDQQLGPDQQASKDQNADARNSETQTAESSVAGETSDEQPAGKDDNAAEKSSSSRMSGSSKSSDSSDATEKPESDEGAAPAAASTAKKKDDESAGKKEAADSGIVKERKSKTVDTSSETPIPAVTYDRHKLELAQKYLQGKGVAQNCDLGVRLLRSAADEPNPDAKIQMGALYLTGHCVQRDQAQAYHWFSQAYSLDPSNSWVEKNLTEIWAQMTPDERRRAEH